MLGASDSVSERAMHSGIAAELAVGSHEEVKNRSRERSRQPLALEAQEHFHAVSCANLNLTQSAIQPPAILVEQLCCTNEVLFRLGPHSRNHLRDGLCEGASTALDVVDARNPCEIQGITPSHVLADPDLWATGGAIRASEPIRGFLEVISINLRRKGAMLASQIADRHVGRPTMLLQILAGLPQSQP